MVRKGKKKGMCQCSRHYGDPLTFLVSHHRAPQVEYPRFKKDKDNIMLVCSNCHNNELHDCGDPKHLTPYGEFIKQEYLEKKGREIRKASGVVKKRSDSELSSYVDMVLG